VHAIYGRSMHAVNVHSSDGLLFLKTEIYVHVGQYRWAVGTTLYTMPTGQVYMHTKQPSLVSCGYKLRRYTYAEAALSIDCWLWGATCMPNGPLGETAYHTLSTGG
jgi:hypothetical protein